MLGGTRTLSSDPKEETTTSTLRHALRCSSSAGVITIVGRIRSAGHYDSKTVLLSAKTLVVDAERAKLFGERRSLRQAISGTNSSRAM
jgi:hypothetical protein